MSGPLDSLPPALSGDLQALAAVMRSARAARGQVLDALGVADEQALLDAMQAGRIPLAAGCEPYLAARTLAALQHNARAAMQRLLNRPDTEAPPAQELSPHVAQHAALSALLPAELSAPPRLTLDAIELEIGARGTLIVRYAAPDAWSMRLRAPDGAEGTLRDFMLPGLPAAATPEPTSHEPASFEHRVRLALHAVSSGDRGDVAH
ncbi:MAG: hypothetical protein RBS46_11040 [Methyloversatilis sp.]|jgi:hypothetical protein|nr:hypothetical protein [Methyloversatilis sp.]